MAATFNAEVLLNTKVNQSSINKAIRSITQVQALVSKLKPINLFAPGAGAGPDKIRTELESILKVSKQINSGQRGKGGLASTFAGANDQARAFLETLRNVNIKAKDGSSKAKVDQLAKAYVRADKEATEYEKTLNDIIRKAQGLQPQAVRDEEVRKRKSLRKRLRAEKKAETDAANERIKQQKRADREVLRSRDKLARETKRKQKERSRRNEQIRNNVGAAAGFPLLFGGGLGSVVGGVGGALLGGFGGSILGSALGQQLDKLAAAALNTAKAFDNVADNLDVVLKKLGESNSTISARAGFLAGEGFTNQAAAAVRQRAVENLGNAEVLRLQKLAKESKELDNALERLGLTLQSWITGPLTALANLISGTQSKPERTAEQTAIDNVDLQKSRIKVLERAEELAKARGGALSPAEQKRLEAYRDQLAVLQEQVLTVEGSTEAERTLLELTRKRLQTLKDIGQAEVSVAERALTERRDVLAGDTGDIAVSKAQAEVTRLQGEIRTNKENGGAGANARNLQLQKDLNEALAKLGVARANASNNVLKAERQINKELEAAEARMALAVATALGVQGQLDRLNQGTLATEERRLVLYQNQRQIQRSVLVAQQELAVLYVREEEVKQKLIKAQERELQLFDRQTALEERRRKATTFELNDRQTAIEQARELLTLEAKINAERQIRATDPDYMLSFSGAGLGFFSESAKLEADQIANRTSQLEKYNEQLALLKQRLEAANAPGSGASGDTKFNLDQQIKDLEVVRNNYESLQPAIDQAALAQARFNDAFNAVSPGVNSLVNGLKEVVAGTKTAEEAFADFLNTIADQLIQTAATMIAQYIAIGIARKFAGIPGGSSGSDFSQSGSNTTGVSTNFIGSGLSGFRAGGGPVTSGSPYVVGEQGPELFVPGASGTIVNNNDFAAARGAMASGSAVAAGKSELDAQQMEAEMMNNPAPIDIKYDSTVINDVSYVTEEQMRASNREAVKEARARVFADMRNKPATRAQVGI